MLMVLLLLSNFCIGQASAGEQKRQVDLWTSNYDEAGKYFDQGELQKAETIYLKSLKTLDHSQLAKSFLKLGEIYQRTKRPSDAEYCYKKSLNFQGTIEGYGKYADFLRERNRVVEAKKMDLAKEAAARQKTVIFPPDIKDSQK